MSSHNHYKHVEQFHNQLMEVLYVFVNMYHIQLDHIYDNDAKKHINNIYIYKIVDFRTCRNPICFCVHIARKFQKNGKWHIWQLSLSSHLGVSLRLTFIGHIPIWPSAEYVINILRNLSKYIPIRRSEWPFNSNATPWWAPISQTTTDESKLPENNHSASGSHKSIWTPPEENYLK